jgi:uncharacterized protein YecE (DUF72 family)
MGEVRIGTSGWSYPTGPGTWNGIFYPAGRSGARGRRGGDLTYYAEHFDTVEVNSSFYRLPDPAATERWARETPAGFDFSLKLFQKFTHPEMYGKGTSPAPRERPEASAIPAVTRLDVDAFKRAIGPIAEASKLGAILAQFPPSFRHGADTREYLAWLLQAFADYPVAVELRHRSWSDHMDDALALLNGHGASWVQIDEPKFRFSIRQDHLPNLRGLYYMRLHGRNAQKWWTHDHPDERYDYLYSPGEIDSFADTVSRVQRLVHTIYVYMNNHFAGKAVANAAALRHRLGQPAPGEYTSEMVSRYPFLEAFVRRGGGGTLLDGVDDDGIGEAGSAETAEDAEPQEG